MSGRAVISVEGLGKKYCPAFRRSLAYGALDIARRLIPRSSPSPHLRKGEFWALHGVSFEVARGEALAIIGHNGAGKSTLLKVIYGLLRADAGSCRVEGRIGALIELGAGLNPHLTASENVVVVAMLHGCSRSRARRMIPQVLAFAELEDLAGIEVRSFSTGMKARLSYAIIALLKPDILLIDEVLAVGDIAFQRKCINHLRHHLAGGGTVLLVSHATHHVQGLCDRAVLLERGRIVTQGATGLVIDRYLETRAGDPGDSARSAAVQPSASGIASGSRIGRLTVTGRDGKDPRTGDAAIVRAEITFDVPQRVYCGIAFWSADGWTCITSCIDPEPHAFGAGAHVIECRIDAMPLMPGSWLARPLFADSVALSALEFGGEAGEGAGFVVKGETDLFTNGKKHMGQLVTMQAAWLRSDR